MAIQFFTAVFQQHVEKNMGFIRVFYANDRKIMAIRANTAKYGSLTGERNKNSHTGCQVRIIQSFAEFVLERL